MNIYDISKKAGVSIATVSRVLNGSVHVSPETRAKIQAVMEKEAYTPNAFARGLGLGSMKTVGILCTDASDAFISDAVYHLEENLREFGYDAILSCTGDGLENKKKLLQMLVDKHVDGIILVGSGYTETNEKDNAYILEASKQIPIMMLNGYIPGKNIYCCLSDDYQAMYDITKQLISIGRKNLLYLYRNENYSAMQKIRGFEDALLKEHTNVQDYMQRVDGDILDCKAQLNFLYSHDVRFDAILTSDDEIAIGALKYAQENAVRVPEDLCIIGYNNSKFGLCSSPELTSIDSNVGILASTTVRNLMACINHQEIPAKTMISTKLVLRRTTKALS